MTKKIAFEEAVKKHFPTLNNMFLIVVKAHGKSHPEIYEVHKLFDVISGKIQEASSDKPDLNDEFAKLREITDNYQVPEDVCESYEAVYNMLAELDSAYQI